MPSRLDTVRKRSVKLTGDSREHVQLKTKNCRLNFLEETSLSIACLTSVLQTVIRLIKKHVFKECWCAAKFYGTS